MKFEFEDELDTLLYVGRDYIGTEHSYFLDGDVLSVRGYKDDGSVAFTRKFRLVEITD